MKNSIAHGNGTAHEIFFRFISVRVHFREPKFICFFSAAWRVVCDKDLTLKILIFVLVAIISSPTAAQVFSTQQQALARIFPKPQSVERRTLFLDDGQVEAIQKLARARLASKIIPYYIGKQENKITGYAFFATDIVRTKEVTYMTVVNPDSTIRAVEILAFYEPMDYLPAPRWLELFRGKWLNDNLWPKRNIHNITGATLTAQSLTQGARKMLAIFQVAVPKSNSITK